MILQVVIQQVLGFKPTHDGHAVEIGARSGPDTLELTFATPDLDGMIDILSQARDAARAKGLPTNENVQVRLPKSVAVTKSADHPGAVMIIFDRNLPTRSVFMIGHAAARDAGKNMQTLGREAMQEYSLIAAAKSASGG